MPVLQVRLDDADHARMKKIADAAGISVSEQVRVWINGQSPALEANKTVAELREEIKKLRIKLEQEAVRPTAPGRFPQPRTATATVRQPVLYDSNMESDPFARFGQSRPAPKPSQAKK